MIHNCKKENEQTIVSYIGSDYPRCLYLYLNLLKYGTDSEVIQVYYQTNNDEITAVMLKYYSCLHLYSRSSAFDAEEIASFFIEGGYTMLYCTAELAQKVYSELPSSILSQTTITKGWVAQIRQIDKESVNPAMNAESRDFDQIVRLIYEDEDIGKSYRFDELAAQLEERNREGYSRNIVLRKGDLVIAHACTNAENDRIAVVAELIVRKDYRQKGYATDIWRHLCGQLLSEGKEVYSFYYSEESRHLHKKVGFFEVCEWAKIVVG